MKKSEIVKVSIHTLAVNQIVTELNRRTNVGWKVSKMPEDDDRMQYFHLDDKEGHSICLNYSSWGNDNRIVISGNWPQYSSNDTEEHSTKVTTVYPRDVLRYNSDEFGYKEITVAQTKSIDGIVDHIRNRFWHGYIKAWLTCKEICVMYEKAGAESYRAAKVLGKKFSDGKITGCGTSAKFYGKNGIGPVNVYYHADDGITVSIDRIGSQTVSKAERILAILAEKD